MKKSFKNDKALTWLRALTILAIAWITLAMVPGSLPGSVLPTQLPLNQFIKAIQKSYHNVRALRADFEQTYVSDGRTRVESGTVIFARGGRMRWDYRKPSKKLFLTNSKEVLLYLPAQNQLNRSSVKKSEDYRVPFRLLLSRVDLHKVFSKFEDAGSAFKHNPQDRVIRAFPKHGEKEGYKQVLMEFDPQLDIRRLELVYTDNSVMKFRFEHIDRNPKLSVSLFHFTPPPGTEVIAQH
ncbi:MAG: outer membrane lipoprotein carrier protein LolA [Acidobacteria bacterium]|nr:outer membrane lipoprotein carrier protein LolA [Acidobacteriota bacterium]